VKRVNVGTYRQNKNSTISGVFIVYLAEVYSRDTVVQSPLKVLVFVNVTLTGVNNLYISVYHFPLCYLII
jgi:hypothetical protein